MISYDIYRTPVILQSAIIFTLLKKKHCKHKKTFSLNMKKDLGMSKPKKHANKVGKLNKPLPYNST